MLSKRLEARDMHVTTLLKKSERAARRKAMQDARERNSQAIRFPLLDASFIGAQYIYIYIYAIHTCSARRKTTSMIP